MSRPQVRTAVLIDADNAAPSHADRIFEVAGEYGGADVRRIYGNFTNGAHASWVQLFGSLALEPVQIKALIAGKNSTDIAMVIDAMDLLYADVADVFVIASSDSDFARLAERLREAGKTVIGIGMYQTPLVFRQACDRFVILDERASARPGQKRRKTSRQNRKKHPPARAEAAILEVLAARGGSDGWVTMSVLGKDLRRKGMEITDFRRCSRLIDVVRRGARRHVEVRRFGKNLYRARLKSSTG